MAIGAVGGAILGFVNNLTNIFESEEEKLKTLEENANNANNEYI